MQIYACMVMGVDAFFYLRHNPRIGQVHPMSLQPIEIICNPYNSSQEPILRSLKPKVPTAEHRFSMTIRRWLVS